MKALSWAMAWSLYWAGDGVSRVMDYWPSEHFHPYLLYSKLMGWSMDAQDWAGLSGPWSAGPE